MQNNKIHKTEKGGISKHKTFNVGKPQ